MPTNPTNEYWASLEREHADLLAALKALLPKDWRDGTMDHMPGVKQARQAIANASKHK